MVQKEYAVYIVASLSRRLYVGMTSNLLRRVYEHKSRRVEGFTRRYHIGRLVYFELYRDVWDAIAREKQIKAWRREKKLALIEAENPTWKDLSAGWFGNGPAA